MVDCGNISSVVTKIGEEHVVRHFCGLGIDPDPENTDAYVAYVGQASPQVGRLALPE